MTKKSFVGQSTIASGLLDLIHSDVCRPLNTQARGGFSYFITFTDDHLWYGYVYLMKYKFEAFGRFKEFRLEVENQTDRKIKTLRSDRGGFPADTRREELLLEESSEAIPQTDTVTSSAPIVPTNDIPVLQRSTRVSQQPERYGFLGLTGQLDNDPKTYGEAMSDIDSKKWIESMKSEISSNKVWTLVDPPKGVKPVWCKWVYKQIQDAKLKRRFLPLRHGVKLSMKQSPKTDEELKKIFDILYASAVGSIQYVVQCTRPDVAFALSVTSRYQACAGEAHWTAVKTILKSQSGFVFKLNGSVVAWKRFKQDTTVDSTTEAEYIAASEAAKEVVGMKNYIQELGVVPSIAELVVIFCDNNGAIVQAKEPRSHHRSKHILRHYHLLREMVGRGDVRMDRVTSAENMADPFTKPVSQIAHAQHLGKMDLRNMSDWL
ncbi:UNVERIFIED_CONTAM: Retrovirus-related Pol polyprotein from transposon TNT 1-94 [Sesamum radiatum]|uniref:Retrovirus-related Pol polyprotein from transposon TNT 1-94 n=1 Tax=Sesamum radiatum TaxID=300843 RepID=A0AAW2J1P6_SESRA